MTLLTAVEKAAESSGPTALDYWTLAIAIVAAITGVAALTAQVWSFALSGPRVKVKLKTGQPFEGNDAWMLLLDVYNKGRLPVTITGAGLAYGRGKNKDSTPVMRLPEGSVRIEPKEKRLLDGESADWVFVPGPIAAAMNEKGIRRVRGYVRLGNGKGKLSSRWKPVDLAELDAR